MAEQTEVRTLARTARAQRRGDPRAEIRVRRRLARAAAPIEDTRKLVRPA